MVGSTDIGWAWLVYVRAREQQTVVEVSGDEWSYLRESER